MTIKERAYKKFKKSTFFNDVTNKETISSGINQFGMLEIHKELLKLEIDNEYALTTYAAPIGSRLLLDFISYYENYFFKNIVCGTTYYLGMVSGATAGLHFIFDYFALKKYKSGIILGYSYTLFNMLADKYNFKVEVITSKIEDKVLPEITIVEEAIKGKAVEFIILTEPQNPSGEMYDLESFTLLLRICKKYNCILLVDKCQRDEIELIRKEKYFSVNKLVYEEGACDNVIFINSLSKTKGVPGLRIGYVMAVREIIDYVTYLNTITYWHCNPLGTFLVMIDILYQLVYLEPEKKNIFLEYCKRNMRKYVGSVLVAKDLLRYIELNSIEIKAEKYCKDILSRYDTILNNYKIVKEYAIKYGYAITELEGGFNFCIKYKGIYTQEKLKEYASSNYSLEIFTQEDFCDVCRNDEREYWVRISCAEEEDSFKKKFFDLCEIFAKNEI